MTQDAPGPSASPGASSGAEPRAGPPHRHSHTHVPGQGYSADTDEGLRAIAIATGAMFVVAAVEFLFFTFSNSAGLLSDALHNLGDVLHSRLRGARPPGTIPMASTAPRISLGRSSCW